jgi:hypothetical protein
VKLRSSARYSMLAESVEDEAFDYAHIGEKKKKPIRTKVLESYRNGLAVGRREADWPARPARLQRCNNTAIRRDTPSE